MEITPAFYAHLLSSFMNISGGKVAVLLEVNVARSLYLYLSFFVETDLRLFIRIFLIRIILKLLEITFNTWHFGQI